MAKRTIRKSMPKIRKEVQDFLISEEGKITKESVAKVGLSLLVLSMMVQAEDAYPCSPVHTNYFYSSGRGGHYSHTSHCSHGSHGSHSNAIGVVVGIVVVGVGVVAVSDTVVAHE